MPKIKSNKHNLQFLIFNFYSNFKFLIVFFLFISLVYSRFVNIGWGLPYPMHPDERNMSVALKQLQCNEFPIFNFQFSNCFNPHFFAYGQFPLYLGYVLVFILKFFDGDLQFPISFQEAVISLRLISAAASVATAFVLLGILGRLGVFGKRSMMFRILSWLIIIFSPGMIQLAHFGTTESLLMLFYSFIIYLSLLYLQNKILNSQFLVLSSLFAGLSLATKVSSVIFLAIPIVVYISKIKDQISNPSSKSKILRFTLGFALCALVFALFFSPHYLISFNEFIASMQYESAVAVGKIIPFYTRQFIGTIPIWFQFTKIFPYALGWPVFLLGWLGMFGVLGRLGEKKELNLLRFAFLAYSLPNAFLFAKWTRFMAPVFPLMLICAVIVMLNLFQHISNLLRRSRNKFGMTYRIICYSLFFILYFFSLVPGIRYLFVYRNQDTRFQASEWMYKNIAKGSYILTETANVIDLPVGVESYRVISFNFYDLDQSWQLQKESKEHIARADYIIVPSRRIFMNHPKEAYPLLNDYYEKLFSGELGFREVARFDAGLRDEGAEETWTVFDHPVIRIYKRVDS